MKNTTHLINEMQEPLEILIKNGALPPIDSAAFGSFLNHNIEISNIEAKNIIKNFMNYNPFFTSILNTCLGRIGLITLPILYEEIYLDNYLIDYIKKGITLSRTLGAKCISLTDLIPSATNYGNNIDISENEDVLLSTGHAVTVSAMVLNIDNVLALTRRIIQDETIAFVGVGSIGSGTLDLILSVLKHPRKIILCDVFNKQQELKKIYERVVNFHNFKGEISIVNPTGLEMPRLIYQEANIIIGATNIPNIVVTSMLKPGTIIVDDSYPYIFDVESCLERVSKTNDIIVMHGGILTLPKPATLLIDYRLKKYSEHESISSDYKSEVMGCILGSILPLIDNRLLPTLGILKPEIAVLYYEVLKKKGIKGSSLQCAHYHYSKIDIEKFSQIGVQKAPSS